jgi:sec-independent protein translocase protein TatB
MPSFSESIFLFVLALLLFGPKKLPVLAREIGKWVGEFRRASNEFKMQMEDELRATEQADRQKQIAAMEAAAPTPALPEPEHPHLDTTPAPDMTLEAPAAETHDGILPIATSGELKIMPPATGLPQRQEKKSALADMLNAIPSTEKEIETVHHGD